MWATYRQHPIRYSLESRLTTDGGKTVSCAQDEAPRTLNRPHRSANGRHRTSNRSQRRGNRGHRNANNQHRTANPLQKIANGHHRTANGLQRIGNAHPQNVNRGQRIANMRQFGSRRPHFRQNTPPRPSCTSAPANSSLANSAFRAFRVFRRPPLPTKPQDRGQVRVGARGRSASASSL